LNSSCSGPRPVFFSSISATTQKDLVFSPRGSAHRPEKISLLFPPPVSAAQFRFLARHATSLKVPAQAALAQASVPIPRPDLGCPARGPCSPLVFFLRDSFSRAAVLVWARSIPAEFARTAFAAARFVLLAGLFCLPWSQLPAQVAAGLVSFAARVSAREPYA
jgi:hypothetical protein